MKHIFLIFVLCSLLLHHGGVFALDYQDEITYEEEPIQINSISNVNRAKLLCNHVRNFEKNINSLVAKYELQDDTTLSKTLKLVSKME